MKSRSTTMYEVPEGGRQYETEHYKPFIEFLKTLGFDIEVPDTYQHHKITIDGVSFHIDYSAAPYMGRNGFTRISAPRKKRFIQITSRSKNIATITFNTEIDRDKLYGKIESEVLAVKKLDKEIADREANHLVQLEKMRKHYFGNENIKTHIKSISASKGILSFMLKDGGYIDIQASNHAFIEFNPSIPKKMNLLESRVWMHSIGGLHFAIDEILDGLELAGVMDPDFQAWVAECYRGSCNQKEVSKY